MHVKNILSAYIEKIGFQYRGMGSVMLVPLAINYLMLPFTAFVLERSSDIYDSVTLVWNQLSLFVPLMATWWVILILEKSLNEAGELFHLYEKTKWLDVIVYYILYLLSVLPLCLHFMNKWPDDIYLSDYGEIFAQAFFSVCLVYLLCFLSRSIMISFVTVLIFSLFIHGRLYLILERFGATAWISGFGYVIVGILCLLLGVTYQKSK